MNEKLEEAWLSEAAKGNPDALRKYFASDKAGIRWGEAGDWKRCVDKVSKYMPEQQAAGFCNRRHKEATGMSTAEHAKKLGDRKG